MPDDLFGVFHEEKGLSLGDPYDKTPDKQPFKGPPFKPPSGPLPSTFITTAPGSAYIEPGQIDKLVQKGTWAGKAFVPTSPSKKSTGAGSSYGCFNPPILNTEPRCASANRTSDDAPMTRRSIYTSPARQGGPGYPFQDRTIGWGTIDFKHVPDEYNYGRVIDKAIKSKARSRIVKPFMGGSNPRTTTFTSNVQLYGYDAHIRHAPQKAAAKKESVWHPSPIPKIGKLFSHPPHVANGEPILPDPTKKPAVFKPPNAYHDRLSMWSPNPYTSLPRDKPMDEIL